MTSRVRPMAEIQRTRSTDSAVSGAQGSRCRRRWPVEGKSASDPSLVHCEKEPPRNPYNRAPQLCGKNVRDCSGRFGACPVLTAVVCDSTQERKWSAAHLESRISLFKEAPRNSVVSC